jgi:hypothetical protein
MPFAFTARLLDRVYRGAIAVRLAAMKGYDVPKKARRSR